eukprot:4167200-Amphidinium_carterae.1
MPHTLHCYECPQSYLLKKDQNMPRASFHHHVLDYQTSQSLAHGVQRLGWVRDWGHDSQRCTIGHVRLRAFAAAAH